MNHRLSLTYLQNSSSSFSSECISTRWRFGSSKHPSNYEIYSVIPKFWGKEGGPSGGQLYVLKWIAKRGWERKGLAGVEGSENESFEWSGSNSSSLHYLSNLLKLLAVKRSSAKRERGGRWTLSRRLAGNPMGRGERSWLGGVFYHVQSWLFNTNPPLFYFFFFVNFSRRTILKAGTNIQRLFVGYFLKKIYVYTYISSTLLAVSREKSFWKFASQRENQVPRNVCRIFYQILNTMKRLIHRKNFGERELLQVEIVRYFFFSIEY